MVTDKDLGSPSRDSRSRSKSPSQDRHETDSKRSVSPSPKHKSTTDDEKPLTDELTIDLKRDSGLDKAKSQPRTRSKSRSISRSRSRTPASRSRSRSPRRRNGHESKRKRGRSHSRSPKRSRSRSRDRHRRHKRDSRERRRRRHSRSYSRSRSPSPYYRRLNPSPCRVIGCFGLSFQTDDRDLKRVFERYGRVDKVKLVTDPRTGRSRGFAFIYMANVQDAEEAKERIHGQDIDGSHVRCEYSISNREHNPTPGIYMGRRTNVRSRSRSRSHERRRRSYSNDRY